MLKNIVKITLLVLFTSIRGFTIDRAILACDTNPMYLQFWPLVARAWSQLIGIKPTLFLITDDPNTPVDTSLGDVIFVKPIPGVSTATHAQVMRLLGPVYFPNDICIMSDIDMLPLKKDYFVDSVAHIPDDQFVVYRDKGYGDDSIRFPMCYNAGKGYLYQSIFKVNSIDNIPGKIQEWVSNKWGWETDEVALYKHVYGWEKVKTNCVFLHHTSMVERRIDRACWGYDKQKLKRNFYVDAHMVRPLDKYRKEIEELAQDLGLII